TMAHRVLLHRRLPAERAREQCPAPSCSATAFCSLLVILAGVLPAHAAKCDTSICVGSGDGCTITGVHQIEQFCALDFSGQGVTSAAGAILVWPDDDYPGGARISARNLTLYGTIQGRIDLDIEVTQSFRTKRPGGAIVVHGRAINGYYPFND